MSLKGDCLQPQRKSAGVVEPAADKAQSLVPDPLRHGQPQQLLPDAAPACRLGVSKRVSGSCRLPQTDPRSWRGFW